MDKAALDRVLLKIHKERHSPPPSPHIKRSRRGEAPCALALQLAPQPDSMMMDRVFDDSRLLVEHLLLQPRDQHRHGHTSRTPSMPSHTQRCSYWISLAGAGQLPLWLLEARSKIKAAMARSLYGEVLIVLALAEPAAHYCRVQVAVSALPLKGAPVCSKFFVRDMLGRGDIALRHTTSAFRTACFALR